MNDVRLFYTVLLLIGTMMINLPVINYLSKIMYSSCKCAKTWKFNYVYFYLLFWYTTTSLRLATTFITPNLSDWFMKSGLYYPTIVISGVSYTIYTMTLWSYVEYLKESKCHCSDIKKYKYVTTYAWLFFLLYIVAVSYLGTVISGIAK
jgi:hypothetical protein